jgi:hypothetical protein
MSKLLAGLCCLMLAAAPLAMAQDKGKVDGKKAAATAQKEPSEKQKAQQERMKNCNSQAGDKKMEGDARKKFMSSCLKGETAGAGDKKTAQQEKMKSCNKEAGDKKMKGDDRKKFMKDCLSK